jgi:hypothetical protein
MAQEVTEPERFTALTNHGSALWGLLRARGVGGPYERDDFARSVEIRTAPAARLAGGGLAYAWSPERQRSRLRARASTRSG